MDKQSSRCDGKFERMGIMFDFRIIICSDGTEIIDTSLKTPYEALTPVQMVEYMQMHTQLSIMEQLKRKSRAEAEHKQKLARNPLYRLACMFGLIA